MKTADLLFSSLITFLKQIESSNWKDLIKIYPEKESENACTEIGQTRISSNPKTTMTKIRMQIFMLIYKREYTTAAAGIQPDLLVCIL